MDNNTVISLDCIWKKYAKNIKSSMLYGMEDIGRNLFGLSSNPGNLRKSEFWAVEDVSLKLSRGQTLGLIGPNGSGKTTILKMINGIFWPDKGKITIRGRVGALIAVGAGFHPLLTGRENIYINGAILGMSRREINKKFESIVEFAEIGKFLDMPVKHYSSGMYVRLGFAIAVHCEPEILLTDEVLAVGDIDFQIKCYQKMHEVRQRGTTIVLVSHNIATIREETENCLYINQGKAKFFGPSEEATEIYIKDFLEQRLKKAQIGGRQSNGLDRAQILGLDFFDEHWNRVDSIESGRQLNIAIKSELKVRLSNPIFGVNFYDDRGFQYCANSYYEGVDFKNLNPGKFSIKINLPNFYVPYNSYLCSVTIADGHPGNVIDWHNKVYKLVVIKAKKSRGSIKIPTKWQAERTYSCVGCANE